MRQLQPVADQLTPTFAALQKLSPDLELLMRRLRPAVTASERGLPAFESILADLPALLGDFQPFLRNANPMVSYIAAHQRDVTSFFANVSSASLSRDVNGLHGASEVRYLRTSQTLNPQGLSYYPRALGSSRENAYPAPNAFDQLAQGLPVLNPAACATGDVDQPQDSDPPALAPLVRQFAFRTDGRTVARPACKGQGTYPGFTTAFPQLRAEP